MHVRTAATAALSLFLLATAACGTSGDKASIRPDVPGAAGAPGDATSQSGSRLRALSFVNGDGSKAPFGWMDTQLQRLCSFTLIFGSTGACVPDDLYTIPHTSTSSYSTTNPGFYLDPKCAGETTGIIVAEYLKCVQDYGLVRIAAPKVPTEMPSCGGFSRDRYFVAEPVDITVTKIYRYDVPEGGGACCSCNEVTSLREGAAAFLLREPSTENLGRVKLVTGNLDLPAP